MLAAMCGFWRLGWWLGDARSGFGLMLFGVHSWLVLVGGFGSLAFVHGGVELGSQTIYEAYGDIVTVGK